MYLQGLKTHFFGIWNYKQIHTGTMILWPLSAVKCNLLMQCYVSYYQCCFKWQLPKLWMWGFAFPRMILFLSAVILPLEKYQLVCKVNEAFKTNKYFVDGLVAWYRGARTGRLWLKKIPTTKEWDKQNAIFFACLQIREVLYLLSHRFLLWYQSHGNKESLLLIVKGRYRW